MREYRQWQKEHPDARGAWRTMDRRNARDRVNRALKNDLESDKITTKKRFEGLTVNGVTIREADGHVLDQMSARNVTEEAIIDAIKSPLDIKPVKYDDMGRPSFQVIGEKATVAINPDTGKLISTWPTHTKTAKKLKEGKK